MATKGFELSLKTAANETLPALIKLFEMRGASFDFKMAVRRLRDEIQAKTYTELAPVREKQATLAMAEKTIEAEKALGENANEGNLAKMNSDFAKLQDEIKALYDTLSEKKITVSAAKIPAKLRPDENILSQIHTDKYLDKNGQVQYDQIDYTTLVVTIWDEVFEDSNAA